MMIWYNMETLCYGDTPSPCVYFKLDRVNFKFCHVSIFLSWFEISDCIFMCVP